MNEATPFKPTQEQLDALPEGVRKYILALERKLSDQGLTLHRNEDELRRKRHAYWGSKP